MQKKKKKKKKKNQNYPAIRRANQWNDYLYASDLRLERVRRYC